MATPSPRKRSYADADLDILADLEERVHKELQSVQNTPQKQNTASDSSGSSSHNREMARIASPTPSSSTLSTLDASPIKPPGINIPNPNPQKRLKLTFAEKEAKRAEREEDQRQRAEIRARKEEERQLRNRERAEEKAQKEQKWKAVLIEREEKRKAREEQDKAREEEKKRREEEKNKKERSQLKLNAFFKQPALSQQESRGSPVRDATSPLGSRRGSISSAHALEVGSRDRSISAPPQKSFVEYEKFFPAFFLHSHTTLASSNRFDRDEEGLEYARRKLDQGLDPAIDETNEFLSKELPADLPGLLHIPVGARRHPRGHLPTVKEVVAQIQGTSYNPVDLTTSTSQHSKSTQTPLDRLKTIPMKSLKFVEDVRPPYIGTCTKLPRGVSATKLGRNPFGRVVPSLDYDYDSEAEWEAPGEGEDLDSEGEDDLEEDEDEEDMKDFVVDEDVTEVKKRTLININTDHTSTGICWEDSRGKSRTAVGDLQPSVDMNQYRIEMIHDNPGFPINPYSTAYWQTETEVQPTASLGTAMNPPRVPLNTINGINQQLPSLSNGTEKPSSGKGISAKSAKPVTVKRFIPTELLEEFKQAVSGSDSTKLGIVEELKKKFPKQSKGAISDTLSAVAERVGPREGDKRWVIKSEYCT
ncbi:hypothetical protein G7Y79_00047g083260 [Physcia stellaris]|nr:hypothetical protein G7Y79_00047g083260 [Physcia stellaris]